MELGISLILVFEETISDPNLVKVHFQSETCQLCHIKYGLKP